MTKVTEDQIHATILEQSGIDTRSLEFRTVSDQQAVLEADVQRIRSSPYLPEGLPIVGPSTTAPGTTAGAGTSMSRLAATSPRLAR
jgi:hypothetical protein